jgi:hypothetical protein
MLSTAIKFKKGDAHRPQIIYWLNPVHILLHVPGPMILVSCYTTDALFQPASSSSLSSKPDRKFKM